MAFAFLAFVAIAGTPPPSLMPARASATASGRIISAARVHLGPSPGQHLVKAAVRIEDGSRRPALLIEFK